MSDETEFIIFEPPTPCYCTYWRGHRKEKKDPECPTHGTPPEDDDA